MDILLKKFSSIEKKAEKVHSVLRQKNQTLSVAESCTGGLLSYFLTIKPAASQFFLGSVVSYSYLSKIREFGISAVLLDQKGAVTESVCRFMAQGIKNKWKTDWALSITGIAGPAKTKVDPVVGVVFIGVLGPNCDFVKKYFIKSQNRQNIRHQSVIFALDFLYSCININNIKKEGGI